MEHYLFFLCWDLDNKGIVPYVTYHLSENSAIKQHLIIKHNNSTNQLTSSDVRKILTDNTIIIYKNNNNKGLQILETIYIKNYKKQA